MLDRKVADMGSKLQSVMKQTTVNPEAKRSSDAAFFAEFGIDYNNPLLPSQIAAKRVERLAQEKKKQLELIAAAQQQAQAKAAENSCSQMNDFPSASGASQHTIEPNTDFDPSIFMVGLRSYRAKPSSFSNRLDCNTKTDNINITHSTDMPATRPGNKSWF